MQVVWLKRDIRVQDHEAVRQAQSCTAQAGAVLFLYVHEPRMAARDDSSAQHTGFVRETLQELRNELTLLGADLCEQVGDPVDVLEALWLVQPFHRLWAYQESTCLQAFERDRRVHAWCRTRDVLFTELSHNAVGRGSVFKRDGFQFRDYLQQACQGAPFLPQPEQAWARSLLRSCASSDVPCGAGADKPGRLRGGRSQAEALMQGFLQPERLREYPQSISSPNTAADGCSRLSPYLAYGVVSDREVYRRLGQTVDQACAGLAEPQAQALHSSVQFFAERLYWRSAYLQSFERRPESELECDLPAFENQRESELIAHWLEAWKRGRTGFPLIDAGMRMLAHTGWVNMRLRGTLTSFALNELWLPWREVGLHLAREFLDYEPGIHWNQIQIHAGSSRLSGPLTYNVVKQAQDHDARGTFVRRWLPALQHVPTEHLYEPWKMPGAVQKHAGCLIGQHYPAPLVSVGAAHEAARKRVAALREGTPQPKSLYWRQRLQLVQQQNQSALF